MTIDRVKIALSWLSFSTFLLAYLFLGGEELHPSLEFFPLSFLTFCVCVLLVISGLIGLMISGHPFEKEQIEVFSGLIAVILSLLAETVYYPPDIYFLKYLLNHVGFTIGITIIFLSTKDYFIKLGVIKATPRTFKPFIIFSLSILSILAISSSTINALFRASISYCVEKDIIATTLNVVSSAIILFYGLYLARNYRSYSYPIEAFKISVSLSFVFASSYSLIKVLSFMKGYFSLIDALVGFTAINIALLTFFGSSMLLIGASMPIAERYGESVLLGIVSIVGYSEYIRNILTSYAREGYSILIITRRGSPLLSVFYEIREKAFIAYLDPETSYPRSISPTEFSLPPETAHIVKLAKIVKSSSKTNTLIIFDNLTDIYIVKGAKKSYEIVKEINRVLSSNDIVYFIVYVKAHDEKNIEVLKSLTKTYLEI